jgi:hypothetical protein
MGASVHALVAVPRGDRDGLERLARDLLRATVILHRLPMDEDGKAVAAVGRRRAGHEPHMTSTPLDPHDFLAGVPMHTRSRAATSSSTTARPRLS